jgi:hypothetical protein
MRGLLEDLAFFPWIRILTALKTRLSLDDWIASATMGAAEMLSAGITTVADACDAGASLAALLVSGQRGIVFREVFGIEREPSPELVLAALKRKIVSMEEQIERHHADDRVRLGISPHAPYTVSRDLFGTLSEYANRKTLRQCIHVAESPAEDELIRLGTGPFAEMFAARAIHWDAPGVSPDPVHRRLWRVRRPDGCRACDPCRRSRRRATRRPKRLRRPLPEIERQARLRVRADSNAAQSGGAGRVGAPIPWRRTTRPTCSRRCARRVHRPRP